MDNNGYAVKKRTASSIAITIIFLITLALTVFSIALMNTNAFEGLTGPEALAAIFVIIIIVAFIGLADIANVILTIIGAGFAIKNFTSEETIKRSRIYALILFILFIIQLIVLIAVTIAKIL